MSATPIATESDLLLAPTTTNGSPSSRPSGGGGWWKPLLSFTLGVLMTVAIAVPILSSKEEQATDDVSGPKSKTSFTEHYRIQGDDVLDMDDEEPRYRATQFISFTINTLGGSASHGECVDRKVDPNTGLCYLGNKDNITEDVLHRIDIVEEVLHRLKLDVFRESPDVDRSADVLKIFMMPEFFLRGPNGAYSPSQIYEDGILHEAADKIRDIIADPAFENYLFVFGTVIAADTPNDPNEAWDEGTKAKDVLYYNYAPVYRGGPDRSSYNILSKRYISDEDFLKRTRLPEPTSHGIHGYDDFTPEVAELIKSRGVKIITDNIIELDGIRIGLEICLDHRMGTLWNSLKTKHKSELVDVQLIISAGMSIERGPNPVVPNGVVYLTDGTASSAACQRSDTGRFDPDVVCREEVGGHKHIPSGGPGYSDFFLLDACIDVEKSSLLKGYYSLFQPQGCAYTLKTYDIDVYDEFAYYPPSIEIYPSVSLPGFESYY